MATNPRTIINSDQDPGLVQPTNTGTKEVKTVIVNYTDPPLYGTPQLQIFNDPGGANGQIQFNKGNRFGGDNNLVWNSKIRTLSVLGNIRVSGEILGKLTTNPSKLKITGGNAGDVLSTDGSGNISWLPAGETTYGNANVANYLPTYTGNFSGNNITITNTGYIYNISSSGIASLTTVNVSANLTTNAIYTDNYFYANGEPFVSGGTPGGSNTQIQFNLDGTLAGHPNFTFDPDTDTLRTPANLIVDNIYSVDETTVHVHDDLETYGTFTAVGVYLSNGGGLTTTTGNQISLNSLSNIEIQADAKTWKFNTDGNLTLPGNGEISINYANGQPYGGSSNANTGNVTFDDINIIGTGNLHLQPDPANSGAFLDVYLTSGPDIHIAGNGENLILGRDDNSNVTVGANGAVSIQSYDYSNSQNQIWTFGADGGLIFPNDSLTIGQFDGVSIISAADDTPLQIVSANANGTSDILWVDNRDNPTQIAGVVVNNPLYVGDADVGIITGEFGNFNLWNFDATGNLTLPGNTFAVNYANGTQVPIGGSNPFNQDLNTTDNVQFNDTTINGNLTLTDILAPYGLEILTTNQNSIDIYTDWGNGEGVEVWLRHNQSVELTTNDGEYSWQFDKTGNIVLPAGGVINEPFTPWESALPSITSTSIRLTPQNPNGFSDQNLLIYSSSDYFNQTVYGLEGLNQLYVTSGNLANTELLLGTAVQYVKLANTGAVEIQPKYDSLSTASAASIPGQDLTDGWIFGANATLTLPADIYAGAGSFLSSKSKVTIQTGPNYLVNIRPWNGVDNGQMDVLDFYKLDYPDLNLLIEVGDKIIHSSGLEKTVVYAVQSVNISWRVFTDYTRNILDPQPGDDPLLTGEPVFSFRKPDIITGGNWEFGSDGNLTLPTIGGTIEGTITTVNGALQLRSNAGVEMDYYDNADENHFGFISIDGTGAYIVNRSNVAGNVSTVEWSFDSTGNFTVPGNIVGSGASPAPSINGFDSISAVYLSGDGSNISNIQVGNVSGLGNIATANLDGNASNVLYGNGVFAAVPTLSGDGGNLSNINAANINGTVANANYSTYSGTASFANSVAGANVTGEVSYAAVANSVSLSNVSGAGNIASLNLDGNVNHLLSGIGTWVYIPPAGNISTLNLDGNASNILYGNGVFSSAPGGGSYNNDNVATFLASFGSNTITTTGNVSVGNIIGNGQSLTGINGANVTGTVANATYATSAGSATTAGTVTTNAQPNITSVGTLTSLTVAGNITGNFVSPGSNTHVMFNDAGLISGNANLTYNKTTSTLDVNGPIIAGTGNPLGGLTNPVMSGTGNVDNYLQTDLWNSSNTANASTDFIAYPNNGTDSSGWIDIGITSNNFTASAYSVTTQNEGYVFMSAVSGSGRSGNLVIATDSTGANNSIEFYVGGFNQVKNSTGRKLLVTSTGANITGALNVSGNIFSAGDVWANSGNFRTSATTANIVNVTPTTVNIAGGASIAVNIGNSSGLVNLSGNVQGNTNGFAIGYRDIPQLLLTSNATIAVSDSGKHYYSTSSSNLSLTIANSATASFSIGAAINIINQGTGTITIGQGSGVTMYLAGNSTSGNRTVSSYGMATIQKVATDTWFIVGVGVT